MTSDQHPGKKDTRSAKLGGGSGGAAWANFGVRHSVFLGLSALVVLASVLAWVGFHRPAPEASPRPVVDPPTATQTDPVEVFKRAFWKRPGAADKILHAERREWSDAHGVKKWQWFIAVEPSPELVQRLRVDNSFNLVPATSAPRTDDSPEWFSFKPADVEILQAPSGNLRLFFCKTDNLLYASDTGGGFRPGAPEVPKAVQHSASAGRLPPTAPPNRPPP